ncbi:hypothetical protein AIR33_23555 [Salmonella enterica]|nr:hypothetical protein [Salmonella enterica]EEJ9029339.1 hypothetical protein [Salmonella enterica subsp. enterica]
MPKLQECQFLQIKVDGKEIGGTSEEKNYTGWMEGFAPVGLSAFANTDGAYFDPVDISLIVTKASGSIFEHFLKRGYKNITITVVHRGSDRFDQNYESQRTIYDNCKIYNISFMKDEGEEGRLFMKLSIIPEGDVEVTFNVPNSKDTALEKIGPVRYSIPEKMLK